MTNLDALTLPGCEPHAGLDGWYFPCGLGIESGYAQQEAPLHPTTPDNHLAAFAPPMVTMAHRRHHEEQHDEMDQWRLVAVQDPQGDLVEMWCECIQHDTHWDFVSLYHVCADAIGGTLYS